MKKNILCVLLLFVSVLNAQQPISKSDNVKIDFKVLAANKIKVQAKDAALMPAYKQLLKEADALLKYKPVSVMDKTALPPSGNKHDYMSLAPYWWPNPATANGLPYIKKDGEVNPEVRSYPDKENLPKLCENINLLSLAYYFSNDEKYAEHAAKLARVWFLDTATRMNPNLNYGQAVKGVIDGRAEGLIDTRHFIFVVDGLELLQQSKHWTAHDQATMQQWFADFLTWMQNSKIGKDELNAKNNHGVWYDAQSLSLALFVANKELANKIVLRCADRLDKQMNADGLFPLELARTTSLHYSVFIMNAFTIVAQLSERTNTDFWTLQTASGKSFKKSFDAILPFLTKEKQWAFPEIKAFNYSDAVPVLLRCGSKFNCNNCTETIKNISKENYDKLLLHLL